MFRLNIAIGNTVWPLLFSSQETADAAREQARPIPLSDENIEIVDDFGQTFVATVSEIKGLLLEDMTKTQLGHSELMVWQTKLRMNAEKRLAADPAVRAAMATGPAVLTPGMINGGFRPS